MWYFLGTLPPFPADMDVVTATADADLEEFRRAETTKLVRRRFEVAEMAYVQTMKTGVLRDAKTFLDATAPMVKEAEKEDPNAGLPRVSISIHYGSQVLKAEVTQVPDDATPATSTASTAPSNTDVEDATILPPRIESPEDLDALLELAGAAPPARKDPPLPTLRIEGGMLDAAELSRLLDD